MHTPYGVITGLFTLIASLFPAAGGAIIYIFLDKSGPATAPEIISISLLLIAMICFAIIPWKLTRPVKDETKVDLKTVRTNLAAGCTLFLIATIIQTSGTIYEKRFASPATKIEKQITQEEPAISPATSNKAASQS